GRGALGLPGRRRHTARHRGRGGASRPRAAAKRRRTGGGAPAGGPRRGARPIGGARRLLPRSGALGQRDPRGGFRRAGGRLDREGALRQPPAARHRRAARAGRRHRRAARDLGRGPARSGAAGRAPRVFGRRAPQAAERREARSGARRARWGSGLGGAARRGGAAAGGRAARTGRADVMRLLRLELTAYGPFAGRELDLSLPGPGGLHLVTGPNEAGKSTALRAVRDLLFGIPENTRDAHRHPGPDLKLGATLERSGGETLMIVRRKKRKDPLRDGEDRPLPEAALLPYLSGLTREVFEAKFGLDHERLQSGGRALLAGKGQLGESLF